MSKYKYYFRKPRTEIAKDVMRWLLAAGALSIAATSPFFGIQAWRAFHKWQQQEKYQKRRFSSVFTRLKRSGVIAMERDGHHVVISLTSEGKKLAGYMQIDALKIKHPKQWDKKWRLVLFDIVQSKRTERNALRAKLQELGFRFFQKSAWICPFECKDEIEVLRNFFGLGSKEVSLVTAQNIEDENHWKNKFGLDQLG
ncbi:MAG: hypothetical protein HYS52_00140 [Candidatus Wildermuthbacteria bacterium]|nr:hypothetical protein [Candidatus Wildermuthbacteria bacterium]